MNHLKKKCKLCNKYFLPSNGNHIYCGSRSDKYGCTYSRLRKYNREWLKKYRINNESRCKEYAKKSYIKHREKRKQEQREYRKNLGKEEYNRRKRLYYQNNKELEHHRRKLKYSRKKNAEGSFTKEQWEELKKKNGYKCCFCKKKIILTQDHIIPLSKGGTNYISNIQPLCRSCNSKKHNKLNYEYKK